MAINLIKIDFSCRIGMASAAEDLEVSGWSPTPRRSTGSGRTRQKITSGKSWTGKSSKSFCIKPEETPAVSTNHFESVFLQVISVSLNFACITAALGSLTWVFRGQLSIRVSGSETCVKYTRWTGSLTCAKVLRGLVWEHFCFISLLVPKQVFKGTFYTIQKMVLEFFDQNSNSKLTLNVLSAMQMGKWFSLYNRTNSSGENV